MAASSRESALPKFRQCPPNGAREGVAVGDIAAAEWSIGVAHEEVDCALVPRNFCLASLGQCRASVPNTQKGNLAPLLAYIVEGLSLYLYSYLYLYYSFFVFITN